MKLLFGMAAALSLFAQDYFPLQKGNQWAFRGSRLQPSMVVEVVDSAEFEGQEYFGVAGLSGGRAKRWLRKTAEGALVEYDMQSNSTRPFLALQSPEGERFPANVDECNKAAVIRSKASKVSVPAGSFDNAEEVQYLESNCADAGVVKDYFVPDLGLVKREETSFAGPVIYELVYARINGFISIGQPETAFSLSAVAPVRTDGKITARLTIRNGGPAPLVLHFTSGQIFNFEVINAAGETVYYWAADKLFPAIIQDITVETEKNWLVEFTVPNGMRPGKYKLEGYLTTAPTQPYRASIEIEVVE
jgi:hypothetical protein